MTRYASRKFLVSLAALGGAHWALFEKLIDGALYVKVVLAVLLLYQAANVTQKATDKTAQKPEAGQ